MNLKVLKGKYGVSVKILLKLSVSSILIAVIFSRIEVISVWEYMKELPTSTALLCLCFLLFQIGLISKRWQLILCKVVKALRLGKVIQIYWVGLFFDQVLVSSIGGDAMRTYLASRENLDLKGTFTTVVMERLIGLFVLSSMTGLLLWSFPIANFSWLWMPVSAIPIAMLVFAILINYLTKFAKKFVTLNKMIQITEFVEQLTDFKFLSKKILLLVFCMSVLTQAITFIVFAVIFWSLQIEIYFLEVAAGVALLKLVLALPISIAGWGLREMTMVTIFQSHQIATEKMMAISLIYGFLLLIFALPGALIFAFGKKRQKFKTS